MKTSYLLNLLIVPFICGVFVLNSSAQNTLQGKVYDNQTKEGLVGVHITIPNTKIGASTNEKCRFTLKSDKKIDSIVISYLGYETQKIKVDKDFLTIKLEPTSIELDQVVVTASREKQTRKNAPLSISTISKQSINDTKASTLPQLLNKVSSLHIADFGNEQQSMSIRQPLSFGKTQLVILEDGVPIGPTAITTASDLKDINLTAISGVEIIRGPSSSLYGSEAIGGAVNFITQGPSLVPTASIALQGTNYGYKRVDFSAGNTFKKFGIFAGGYYANVQDGYVDYSDFDKLAVSFKANYLFTERTKLTATASYVDFYTDFAGSLDSTEFFEKNQFNQYAFCYQQHNVFRASLKLDHFWSEKSKTFVTLFFRDNKNNEIPTYKIRVPYARPPKVAPPPYGEYIEAKYQSYGLIAQHKQELKFWNTRIIAGISVDYSPQDYLDEYLDSVKINPNSIFTEYIRIDSQLMDYSADLLNTAAYAQIEISPIKNLKVIGAVRYDRLDYDYDTRVDTLVPPDEKNSFDHLSPKIGVTYNLKAGIGIFGNFTVGFAPPQFSQLYKYKTIEVPMVEPSTYYNYEFGLWFSFLKKKGYFDLSLYQSDGYNEMVSRTLDDGSTISQSVGKTRHRGVEYTLKLTLLKDISFNFVGTYALHEYIQYLAEVGGPEYDGNEMNIAPRWVGNAGITYKPKYIKNFRIGAEWQSIGEYWMDELNSDKYEGYDIFNLRAGYKFKSFDIWLNIINLTDEIYSPRVSKSYYRGKPSIKYVHGIPRTFTVGIGYNFVAKNGHK